jgi:hypothetical protein
LRASRTTPGSLILELAAAGQSCAMLKGVVQGLARSFGERVELVEPACTVHGDPECRILVVARGFAVSTSGEPGRVEWGKPTWVG